MPTGQQRIGRHEPAHRTCVVASDEVIQPRFGIPFFAGKQGWAESVQMHKRFTVVVHQTMLHRSDDCSLFKWQH